MFQEAYYVAAIAGFLITTLLWLTNKFASMESRLKATIQSAFDKIMEKLEYHERHDDERFNHIRNDIVTVQLRNASKDVVMAELQDDMKRLIRRNGQSKRTETD